MLKKFRKFIVKLTVTLLSLLIALTVLLMLGLRWVDPPTSSYIIRYELAAKRQAKHQWVDFDQIHWTMPLAAIAAEDQRFPKHWGFDTTQIRIAWQENRKRGASTISQQTIKNLFLWPERSYLRKGVEAWLTLWMEIVVPKKRILEIYLNIAQFGKSVFGIEAAANHYFGVSAKYLTATQSRLLAASLPTPSSSNPAKPSDYLQQREQKLAIDMSKLGGQALIKRL